MQAMDNEADISSDIAVVGLACRLPGALDAQSYWQNVRNGVESVTVLTDDQLRQQGVSDSVLEDPHYVKAAAVLEKMDQFDPGFFGFGSLEASMMDPQHRQFLEVSWEALENAGYDPAQFDGAIGVFGGSGHNAYMPYNLFTNPQYMDRHGLFLVRHTGNDKDFLTTRVSYCLNLTGPSVNVQTACSTSLVAAHLAAQSLLSHECDMALAGGVTIELPHHRGYLYQEGEILAPDGHCRPFDANSQGTLFGSGAGVLVLRRMEDAIADGDHILAVLKASAVNNDGAGKVSYMAPSVDGQAAAIHEALMVADISPETIDYIECHGTGTPIGDPIEIAALTSAFQRETDKKQFCGVGSVKANIGHLDTAAGVASAIKVIQALRHRELPPNINFTAPNPAIDWESSPFYVNAQCKTWHGDKGPRRAGVSSLGVGGTNAHLIFEEAPKRPAPPPHRSDWVLLALSARSEKSLNKSTKKLARFLTDNPELPLADIAYTLQVGRKGFTHRRVLAVKDHAAGAELLSQLPKDRVLTDTAPEQPTEVAFMFAGGGAQFPNMGQDLYQFEAVYRDAVDECLGHLKDIIDFDLKALMYPSAEQREAASVELERPTRSLTSLFTTQYAQAKLWMSWGIQPSCLTGHSMGENTAACLAGVISLRDALGLVALRGQLFETIAEGGMLGVQASEQRLRDLLGDDLSLACVNGPELSVVSGPSEPLGLFEQTLSDNEIEYQRVRINIAAHSSMLEPILEKFGSYLRSITLNAPTIPLTANLTGTWMTDEQAQDPEYWVAHLRNTVRFADCAQQLLEKPQLTLLEVGPGKTLATLCQMHPGNSTATRIIHSMGSPDDSESDQSFMLRTFGALWQAGSVTDWRTYWADEQRQRLALPSYSFDHARYWVEPGDQLFAEGNVGGLKRHDDLQDWFYQPIWRRAGRVAEPGNERSQQKILVVGDGADAQALASRLEGRAAVARATAGSALVAASHGYSLPLADAAAWTELLSGAGQTGEMPTDIVVFTNSEGTTDPANSVFQPLFALVKAIADEDPEDGLNLTVVTRGLFSVGAEPVSNPGQALALGPVLVANGELSGVTAQLIDLELGGRDESAGLAALEREIVGRPLLDSDERSPDPVLAIRAGQRFVRGFDAVPCMADAPLMSLKAGDTVLITGGIGGLALVIAEHLASQGGLNLVMVSRRQLPPTEQWSALAQSKGPLAERFASLLRISDKCSIVHMAADITQPDQVTALRARVTEQFGPVTGVVHTAGVIDDALIQLKTPAEAAAVLAPKVQGSRLLDQAFGGEQLKFFVAFSSVSAVAGLPGQIDYAAANAYLDAFCKARDGADGTAYTAIAWPAWRQVGMAASIADGSSAELAAMGQAVAHPMLGVCTRRSDKGGEFIKVFSPEQDWVLDEHRIAQGDALIPGAGYIELARAAYAELTGQPGVSMANVFFMAPFFVPDDQRRALKISIDLEAGEFLISSDMGGEWMEHCRGDIAPAAPRSINAEPRDEIIARCTQRTQKFDDPDHHPHLDFGPRWASLKDIHLGQGEALEVIDLGGFVDDLEHYHLHPAMLDMATAGAQALIPGYQPMDELYVPVGYQNMTYFGSTSARWFSHIRYKETEASADRAGDSVTFDIVVTDEAGSPLLMVENFTMQRVAGTLTAPQIDSEPDPALKRTLELGISPKEGAAAFDLALTRAGLPQLAVTPFDITPMLAELNQGSGGGSRAAVIADSGHDADCDPDIPAIEAAMADHEAIALAVVRSHLDEEDERRLVAHFVVDPDEYITVSDLRRHLKKVLAAELMPHHLIEVDEIALDSKGQPKRKTLPDPYAPVDTFQEPETATQKAIADIWRDVLDAGRIGVDENFFDLGGHSLLSIRAITKTNKKFGVQLNQAIMALQTLEQIAAEVDSQRGVDSSALEAQPEPDEKPAEQAANPSAESQPEPAPRRGLVKSLFGKRS